MQGTLSKATLGRLPRYLQFIRAMKTEKVSAAQIARGLGLGEVQVRKDLASVCAAGLPKVGYPVAALLRDMKKALRLQKLTSSPRLIFPPSTAAPPIMSMAPKMIWFKALESPPKRADIFPALNLSKIRAEKLLLKARLAVSVPKCRMAACPSMQSMTSLSKPAAAPITFRLRRRFILSATATRIA